MEMSSLLALDANDRAIGDFLIGLPVPTSPGPYPILTVPQPSDVVGEAKKGAAQHGPKASFGSVETGVR